MLVNKCLLRRGSRGRPLWPLQQRALSKRGIAVDCRSQQEPDRAHLSDYEHPVDVEQFRKLGYAMVDRICEYYSNMQQQPVVPKHLQPGYLKDQIPQLPPEQAQSFEEVMQDVERVIMPGVVHWQHPRFFAYFSANSSFPGQLAEMLMTALNMIGFSWAASPVSTELEMAMMDWLVELCRLPHKFKIGAGAGQAGSSAAGGGGGGGVIQGTSSEAVLVALLAARAKALRGRPAADKLKLVAYASDQTHSCFKKACMVAGIDHVRVLPARPEDGYALQPSALEAAMAQDVAAGLIPAFLCATIGTTSSCAVDPVGELAQVAHSHGAWAHVDAAYAGSASILPEMDHYFKGLEHVDSYNFNPHKWLLTNFDCCAMFVSDQGPLKEALSFTPVFLQATGNALDYKDLQVPLGRKFRSLKLYFVLRMYGAEKLRQYIRHHVALAQYFAGLVRSDARFELAAEPRFGLVCFRLRGAPREANMALLEAINARGDMFLIHTELSGQYTLRLAVGSTTTQLEHIDQAWAAVSAAADGVTARFGAAAASTNSASSR